MSDNTMDDKQIADQMAESGVKLLEAIVTPVLLDNIQSAWQYINDIGLAGAMKEEPNEA